MLASLVPSLEYCTVSGLFISGFGWHQSLGSHLEGQKNLGARKQHVDLECFKILEQVMHQD